jgi:collagenase-like PrtC family protease
VPQTRFAPITPMQRLMRPRVRPRGGVFMPADPQATAGPILASRLRQIARPSIKAATRRFAAQRDAAPSAAPMELVCQADSLAALQAVVDNGADCVHLDYTAAADGQSNRVLVCEGIRYAHDNGCKLVLELNMQSRFSSWEECCDAIDSAARAGVDAIISADPALLLYASANHPGMKLQSRVFDAATLSNATTVFHKRYGISRIVLPCLLSLRRLEQISDTSLVELEVAGFGTQCAIVEGRRSAPEASAAEKIPGSPVPVIGLGEELRSASVERCAAGENAANEGCYATPASPDIAALRLLPRLRNIGVRAIRVEAQGGNPAKSAQITRVWRDAIDSCIEDPERYTVKPAWIAQLSISARQPRRCRP